MNRFSSFYYLAAVLVLSLSGAQSVHAASAQPLSFGVRQLQITWVEQESAPAATLSQCLSQTPCVVNDTGCLWNVGDFSSDGGSGYLAAGSSVSVSRCYEADGYEHFAGDNKQWRALVSSSSPDLSVTLVNDQGVSLVAAPPALNSTTKLWDYGICTYDLSGYPNLPDWYPAIANPDGNGTASGLKVIYTMQIGNPTGRQVKSVYGAMNSYSDFDAQQKPC